MIKIGCTNCDETVNIRTQIESNGDMIIECLGCGDIKRFANCEGDDE